MLSMPSLCSNQIWMEYDNVNLSQAQSQASEGLFHAATILQRELLKWYFLSASTGYWIVFPLLTKYFILKE